jgi:hypothetical protein
MTKSLPPKERFDYGYEFMTTVDASQEGHKDEVTISEERFDYGYEFMNTVDFPCPSIL